MITTSKLQKQKRTVLEVWSPGRLIKLYKNISVIHPDDWIDGKNIYQLITSISSFKDKIANLTLEIKFILVEHFLYNPKIAVLFKWWLIFSYQ